MRRPLRSSTTVVNGGALLDLAAAATCITPPSNGISRLPSTARTPTGTADPTNSGSRNLP